MPRIYQLYFEAATFEQFEQRNPVNSGRFHRHRGDAALLEPISQGIQIRSESTKLAYGNFVATFGYRHHVSLRADIDTRSVEVDVLQLLRQTLQLETFRLRLLPALCHGLLLRMNLSQRGLPTSAGELFFVFFLTGYYLLERNRQFTSVIDTNP